MQYYPFDSRQKIYRSHIGAVAAEQPLQLRLLLHTDAHVHDAFLRIKKDGLEQFEEIKMTPGEKLEDYRFYEAQVKLQEGLYWYSFRYTSDYGEFYVTKTENSLGIVSALGESWQQTVYEADFKTPDWLSGGIIYQIFPDRFKASGKEKKGVPEDRFLCSEWRRLPEYRQNGEGYSLGNDYYGGDLAGITEKLPYLEGLGVTCIYLNPIFEAHSNHRYNTADYMKIDPLLGDRADLITLCKEAKKHGISIILDGVFSHTGDDSIYFNRRGRYSACGAYNSPDSPYRRWYNFNHFPDDYSAWWGVPSLPETRENDESFSDFVTGEKGVLRYWLKCGIKGWRLDVADELPDSFLDKLRIAVKSEDPDAYILGEVWEDASNKISYGVRRRFLRGRQLDSVMNYPFANAIISFVCGSDAKKLVNTVLNITENYPPQCTRLLMNHIGTHDTMRIITRLAKGDSYVGDREWQSHQTLSKQEYDAAANLLKIAAVIQYTLPGVPSIFYGDEAGVQGYGDPFCRAAFPWGDEDKNILTFYKKLGKMRRDCDAFKEGEFVPLYYTEDKLVYERIGTNTRVIVLINLSDGDFEFSLPQEYKEASCIFGSKIKSGKSVLSSKSAAVYKI